VLGAVYSPLHMVWNAWLRLAVFTMLLVGSATNTDRPLYLFCIELLLGSKYAGSATACARHPLFFPIDDFTELADERRRSVSPFVHR
jgi:hypothetical protein